MAFTGNYICTSFKQQLLEKIHDFNTDTLKLALFTNSATLDATTTAYSATGEASGTGYVAGGKALTGTVIATGFTATGVPVVYVTFDNPAWPGSTLTFRGGLIYNSSVGGNPAIAVLDFGSDKTYTASTITIQMPTADATNAIIRI